MMDFQFRNQEELHQFIAGEVLTTPEAVEYLGISRQALISLVQQGKLKPFKEVKTLKLFFKSDLEKCRKDAEKMKRRYYWTYS